MARTIQTLLDEIETAVYGEDVRSAIHDAIESCYDDVDTARTAAESATRAANTAAASANSAALSITAEQTGALARANAAISNANTVASNVTTAVTNANTAASAANTAATSATSAASAANTAASTANAAASIITEEDGLRDQINEAIQNATDAYDAVMDNTTGAIVRVNSALDEVSDSLYNMSTTMTDASAIITRLETLETTSTGLISDMGDALTASNEATAAALLATYGNAEDYDPEDAEYVIGAFPAAELAQAAAETANTAAANADEQADRVDGAIEDLTELIASATEATESATNAATQASVRASEAADATATCNTRTTECLTATEAARTQTLRATSAAQAIEGMTVATTTLPATQNAYVEISDVSNHKHVIFGIPRGPQGPGFIIKGDHFETVDELQALIVSPDIGDMYNVGLAEPYDVYRWTGNTWENQGPIGITIEPLVTSDIDTLWGSGATPSGSQLSGSDKYMSDDSLYYMLNTKLTGALATKVDVVTGKTLTSNDLTNELKSKYDAYETSINSLSGGKVDKVVMDQTTNPPREKVLSANDFTDAKNAKLTGIETGADVTVDHTDAEKSLTSNNPLRNSVITAEINGLKTDDLNIAHSIAPEYATKSYSVGDYCIRGNKLYVCNTEIVYAEAWNSDHWTATNLLTKVLSYEQDMETMASDIADDINDLSSEVTSYEALHISIPTFASLPITINNTKISSDMRVIECTWSNPQAIISNITWSTVSGSLVLSGSIDGSTTAEITLIKTNS